MLELLQTIACALLVLAFLIYCVSVVLVIAVIILAALVVTLMTEYLANNKGNLKWLTF